MVHRKLLETIKTSLKLITFTRDCHSLADSEEEIDTPPIEGNRGKVTAVDDTRGFKSPDQLSDELVTLSLLPQSRWRHLTSLELIKVSSPLKIDVNVT